MNLNDLNPFDPTRPLSPHLFVGRQEALTSFERAVRNSIQFKRPEFLLVTGPRGSGKTSLLTKIKTISNAPQTGLPGNELALATLLSPGGDENYDARLLKELRSIVIKATSKYLITYLFTHVIDRFFNKWRIGTPAGSVEKAGGIEGVREQLDYIEAPANALYRSRNKKRLLAIVIDEADNILHRSPTFVAYLRQAFENLECPVLILLFGLPALGHLVSEGHASAPRSIPRVSLKPLTSSEISELIRVAMKWVEDRSKHKIQIDPTVSDIVFLLTGGHPVLVQKICHEGFLNSISEAERRSSTALFFNQSHISSGELNTKIFAFTNVFKPWLSDLSEVQGRTLFDVAHLEKEKISPSDLLPLAPRGASLINIETALEALLEFGFLNRNHSVSSRLFLDFLQQQQARKAE